ncbi:MarR family transcriptional regulator [Tissierella sp.]|uniref:MarR family winged helix-turn-helix transcriptional regulator n=1 Tax=Tissierella sp. TaxID=41274 RepID=UPI002857918D|nr:MarR family transcriptional regulator [Tissierella sp.]MDR7855111.1 MarR family transcriptional regulator [Tissierella sp.]
MDIIKKDSLYYLFLEIQKLHYHRIHVLLDEIGVYHGQPHMLITLNRKDGQSQKELAESLNIRASTITVMLKRMEKANLVIRKQDDEDQRISRVYITEEGREICKKAIKVMENLEEECFGNLTVEEKAILRRLLMQMKDNLLVANDVEKSR